MTASHPISLPATRIDVRDEWIDYNGHLSEAYYVLAFSSATDAVMNAVGMDAEYRRMSGCSFFTVDAHIRFLQQVRRGEELVIQSSIAESDEKRMRLNHSMYVEGHLTSTIDVLGVHVQVEADTARGLSFPPAVRQRIEALKDEVER